MLHKCSTEEELKYATDIDTVSKVYTCGRAVSMINSENDKFPKIVIYNTIGITNDYIDTKVMDKYLQKYLKYKRKYLELKNLRY
jgi:hypothetical protein